MTFIFVDGVIKISESFEYQICEILDKIEDLRMSARRPSKYPIMRPPPLPSMLGEKSKVVCSAAGCRGYTAREREVAQFWAGRWLSPRLRRASDGVWRCASIKHGCFC